MTDFLNLVRIELYNYHLLMIISKTLDPPLGFVIILIQTITFTANHRVNMMRFGQLINF